MGYRCCGFLRQIGRNVNSWVVMAVVVVSFGYLQMAGSVAFFIGKDHALV